MGIFFSSVFIWWCFCFFIMKKQQRLIEIHFSYYKAIHTKLMTDVHSSQI